ncbi:MAG: DUF6240 domain-containing protein [Lachnospiraceae bacterium]|nr:DUF6240 domain-containing protein [Lachnospiraceae bacterium]
MNINLNEVDRMSQNSYINVNEGTTAYSPATGNTSKAESGYRLDISSFVTDNNAYAGHGKTIEEVMADAGMIDVNAYRDYMVVMSNCLSTEDFTKLQNEGVDPGHTDFSEVVSIVDHIKTALIKGGTEVVGYTDTISKEALTSITGSQVYADELSEAMNRKDIPVTRENAEAVENGFKQLTEASPLGEGSVKYMVENNLKPTVENIYTASFCGGNDASRQSHGYYSAGDVAGYYAKKSDELDVASILPQAENVIKEAGMEVNDENVKSAMWLVDKGIPLTTDTLKSLNDISSLSLPMEHKEFVEHATDALMDGINVIKADLTRNGSLRDKAISIYDEVQSLGTIKGRRVLEEVRLSMTIEANLKLLKSGYQIDTAPMEDLVENLKKAEEQIAKELTGEKEAPKAVEKKKDYEEALSILGSIKNAPISISYEIETTDTLRQIDDKAVVLRSTYEKAGQSYETLMSAPRRDLGDSIQKAFRNVDELLDGIDEALTDENRRAVRILGYNSIEITKENLDTVRAKDKLLTETIENLTPGRVLGMIREGINPVSMSLEELDGYLKEQDTTADDMMSFSKFLYKLEKSNDITEDEKEAYIGIYRLVRQIEKADHSVIGAIEEMNAEYSFDNMLKVLRSRKHKSMDYKIDETFTGVDVKDTGIESISSQISKGFLRDTNDLKNMLRDQGNQDAAKEYDEQILEEIRKTVRTEAQILEQLSSYNMEISPSNIADMQTMLQSPMSVFERLKELGLKKEFKEIPSSKEEAQSSFKEFTGSIKDFLENEVFGRGEILTDSANIKRISKIYAHMDFLERQSQEENYEIPTSIGGQSVAINLKVIHGESNEQKVAISFGSDIFGNVAAEFKASSDGLSGYCSLENKEMASVLNGNTDTLREDLSSQGIALKDVYFVNSASIDLYQFNIKQTKDRITDTDVITTDNLYKAAKSFIGFMDRMAAERN